ncbi:MAG: hypothetical protein O9265_02655, partial [Flavobacterium sp.]|nr:hypothetical protein [Flavobacterium sp.]
MASAEIKQTSGVKLKTVKNINGRARKRHLAKPQNVKLSKNPFTFIFIICIKKLSIYLCNLLIFCIFMHEIYQRNQQ